MKVNVSYAVDQHRHLVLLSVNRLLSRNCVCVLYNCFPINVSRPHHVTVISVDWGVDCQLASNGTKSSPVCVVDKY